MTAPGHLHIALKTGRTIKSRLERKGICEGRSWDWKIKFPALTHARPSRRKRRHDLSQTRTRGPYSKSRDMVNYAQLCNSPAVRIEIPRI